MAIRKTLYEVLQVARTANTEVIDVAYETRLRALGDSGAPEVIAERTLLRDAHAILSDPVRRKLYEEKLREQAIRAMTSGGVPTERPANSAAAVEAAPSSPLAWMIGVAIVAAVGVGGGWVYLSHKRAVEAQRLEEARQAQLAREREAEAQRQQEAVDWAKAEYEKRQKDMAMQRWEAQGQRDRAQMVYTQQQVERDKANEARRKELDKQRQEQENLRRSQADLARQQRYLQQLERERAMRF